MSKILEALEKLDPQNDNHWTTDGLPRIETVRMLAADQTITRETLTAASPNFSRQTATAPVTPATGTEPETNVVSGSRNIDEEIEVARERVAHGQAILVEVQAALSKEVDALDALINEKHASGAGETNADAIQGYLASQKKQIAERGRRAQVLRESGVTLADIRNLIPEAAPLDQALAKKR